MRIRVFLLSFLYLVFLGIPASASEADDLYKEGSTAYLAGDYATAIIKFERAATLDKDPLIRLNLSLCYEALENYPKALRTAKSAQKGELSDELSSKNAARIAAFRRILQVRKNAKAISRIAAGDSLCSKKSDCDLGKVCNASGICEIDENIKYTQSRFGAVGYIGTAVMLAGAGILGYTIAVIDTRVGENEEKLNTDKTLTRTQQNQLSKQIDDDRSIGLILLATGAGVAVTGLGILVYDLATVEEVPIALSPILSPTQVGANFSVKF